MNAGIANLYTLKQHLLPASLLTGTTYNATITAIGLGVAAHFERFCNRKFIRTAADTYIVHADRQVIVLPRFPIESISAVALKTNEEEGWQTQDSDVIEQLDHAAGIVQLAAPLGTYLAQVRFTYTGGYWWEQAEPADAGYPTTQPAGSTALPDDLKFAWLQQCARVWEMRDKLGAGVAADPEAKGKQTEVHLTKQTVEMLQSYRRFA
jgi:hypothetical protein